MITNNGTTPIRKPSNLYDIIRCGYCLSIVKEHYNGFGKVVDRDDYCPKCGTKINWEISK